MPVLIDKSVSQTLVVIIVCILSKLPHTITTILALLGAMRGNSENFRIFAANYILLLWQVRILSIM